MLVLPSDNLDEYVVAGARTNRGYDSNLSRWGVETYRIDQSCSTCYGIGRHVEQYPGSPGRYNEHIHEVGDSVSYGQVSLSVIERTDRGYVVEVSGLERRIDRYIDDEGTYELAIEALASEHILEGTDCGPGRICPDDVIKRWTMAVWLVRVLDGVDPVNAGHSSFVDVDARRWWAPFVDRLADLGVTKGCSKAPAEFCPDEPVTRAQMASFLTRTFELRPGPAAGFIDTGNTAHREAIDALAQARITIGCATNPARYCPDDSVTRVQMATFLARALKLISVPISVERAATGERIIFTHPDLGLSAMDPDGGSQRKLDFVWSDRGPVWSPDGGRIVFHSDRDGDDEIYVSDPNGRNLRQLTQNEGDDQNPVWSPDGSRIVFHSDRDGDDEIYVSDPNGRNLRQLTQNEGDDQNPVWSPDGTLIAFIRAGVGIFAMDADGSSPRQLTQGGGWDTNPSWSPNSRTIVFTRRDFHNDEWNIFSVDSDGNDTRQLTRDSGWNLHPAWSPDGRQIAFTRHDGWAGDREVFVMDSHGADQRMLTENCWCKSPVWSPDGSRMAVITGSWADDVLVMDADGNNSRRITDYLYDRRVLRRVAWSSDGARISFVRDGDVVVMDADGRNTLKLSGGYWEEGDTLVWSPDGSRVAFQKRGGLFVMDANGGRQKQLVTISELPQVDPAWSSDGTRITFAKNGEVFVVDADGGAQRQMTNHDVDLFITQFAWSPDGSNIAYVAQPRTVKSLDLVDDRDTEIYMVNVNRAIEVQLTDNRFYEYELAWSPDSTRLAFRRRHEVFPQIFVIEADGSNQQQLTTGTGAAKYLAWSPDGTRIAFSRADTVFVVDPDSGIERQLTETFKGSRPVWSPDGTRIAYHSFHTRGMEIFVMNADGTNHRQLTFGGGQDPSWLPGE